jgi:hypothetical protein
VLWLATVVSNIGTWMQNAAAGWLMTGLDPDPFIVSLVQVATSLPMFLFALAGGALADIVDRRKLLIVIQTTVVALVAGFGLLVWRGHVTPAILLAFSFLAGTAAALIAPAVPASMDDAVALVGALADVDRRDHPLGRRLHESQPHLLDPAGGSGIDHRHEVGCHRARKLAEEMRRADRFPDRPFRLLAELPASDSGSQSENVESVLEDTPLKHSRRANEAVGSTTTVIQQHLTSFAS